MKHNDTNTMPTESTNTAMTMDDQLDPLTMGDTTTMTMEHNMTSNMTRIVYCGAGMYSERCPKDYICAMNRPKDYAVCCKGSPLSLYCMSCILHIDCIVCEYSEASLIQTPLIRIIYLSGHMFVNQL